MLLGGKMSVTYTVNIELSEEFFQNAFIGKSGGDMAEVAFNALAAAFNQPDERIRKAVQEMLPRLISKHFDLRDDMIAAIAEVKSLIRKEEHGRDS